MDNSKNQEIAIDLEILKWYHFYQMLDPNSTKFFGWNIFQLYCIIFTTITQFIVIYGIIGLFVEMDDTVTDAEFFLTITVIIQNSICFSKISIILYNACAVCDLFDVARLNFLTSKYCHENIKILNECRVKSVKLTNMYCRIALLISAQWLIFPIVLNMFMRSETEKTHRLQNIVNLRFPVTTHTYNQYYVTFYIMEIVVSMFFLYIIVMFDVFFMSICWVISAQYNVLSRTFERFGHVSHQQTEEEFDDFVTILIDQQQVHTKLKSFNCILKPIILIFVGVNSSIIIMLTYAFILICVNSEVNSFLVIFKVGCSIFFGSLQLYIYCSLLDNLNHQRESVNFGIYSCNWTKMNLKFQKLLLLSMSMNNANCTVLKFSPGKVINLQIFASVMIKSYNVVSVMLKTMSNNK